MPAEKQDPNHAHYFVKVKGLWKCECGELRNKKGAVVKPRRLRVI